MKRMTYLSELTSELNAGWRAVRLNVSVEVRGQIIERQRGEQGRINRWHIAILKKAEEGLSNEGWEEIGKGRSKEGEGPLWDKASNPLNLKRYARDRTSHEAQETPRRRNPELKQHEIHL